MQAAEVRVDRNSPVPLYFQVSQQLEAAIHDGSLPAGSRLTNEIRLASEWGVSRPTVRQAIQHLVDKGLLVRKRGVGTQVVQPWAWARQISRTIEVTSLYDDLAAAGQEPRTDVLECGVVAADEEIAEELGLVPGAEVVRLRRLRRTGDEPLALMTNYLPAGLVELSAGALALNGLYETLRGAGINLRIAHQTIGARPAAEAEAKLLEEHRGAPLLTMTRVAFDDKGRAVEYGCHVYRAAHYSFTLTLVER